MGDDRTDNFMFQQIHECEVINAIFDVKSNATGSDGISTKFLKIILPLIIPRVTCLFNMVITSSTFPSR